MKLAITRCFSYSGASWYLAKLLGAVLVGNDDLHGAHVGRQEVLQDLGASTRLAIEGEAHGLAIRIEAIAQSAVGSGDAAAAICDRLVNLHKERGLGSGGIRSIL